MAGSKRVLLVEGSDDREVIYQICNHFGIPNRQRFAVEPCEGVEQVIRMLAQYYRGDYVTLGAVVDADLDAPARWRSLREGLRRAGCSISPSPFPDGLLHEQPDCPRLGLWLMPDNRLPGMMEDFLRFLVPPEDALLPLAERAVDGIPDDVRRFRAAYRSKALIHTWLAWQDEPGTPLGSAVTRCYLRDDCPPLPSFVAWLRRLFDLPA